jgi:hypothetical protein
MAVNLSPYGGVGAQFLDNAGNVLTGGKIFTYAAGTTTNQVTYTTSAGNIPHSNPIILDASGRVPSGGEIWLTDGLSYKFILRDANDVLIATYDNVTGINSNFVAFTNQQEIQTATAGQTVFNLTTTTYSPGTNSLSVFVDGVNQYGPGAQYAYLETNSTTITFVNGLHVGALVKFTTSQLNSSGAADACQVSYVSTNTNIPPTTVCNRLDDIYRYHPNINNVATVTVYCDPVSGSDSNPGTLLQPYQTFQHAVDMCPQTLTFQYIIDLVSAATLPVTYNEDVLIRDIHAPVTDPSVPFLIGAGLQIIGAGPDFLTDDPKDCKIGSLTISGCSGLASPELFGAHILRASPYYQSEEYIGIYATEEAQLYNLSFEPVLPAIAGVRVFRAGVTIKGIDITGLAHAIWAKRLANGNVFNWYGTYWTGSGAGAVFRSEESSIVTIGFDASVSGGSAPVGVTNANLFNYNYGLVADLFGIRFARRMFYGNPEYNSTYGTDSFGAGQNFNISGAESVAIGLNARGDAAAAVSIGPNSDAGATASVALGSATLANSGIRATAIGSQAEATGEESVALGFDAVASHANANAIGADAATTAANTTMIGGPNNTVTQTYGSLEVIGGGGALFLRSPNNTRYRLSIDNAGALVIAAAP